MNSSLRKLPAILLAGLFAVGAASASEGAKTAWHQMAGPGGGQIVTLAIDPQTPSILYAGTEGGGIFKSVNGGQNWKRVYLRPEFNQHLRSIVIDPKNSKTVYAVQGYMGLAKSPDGGQTWSEKTIQVDKSNVTIYSLAVDPRDSKILFAGTDQGIFKSSDGGLSWIASSDDITGIHQVIILPQKPGTIFCGTSYGIFKSIDGGEKWVPLLSQFQNLDISVFQVNPANPNALRFYSRERESINVGGGLFGSNDGGKTWVKTTDLFDESIINAMAWSQTPDHWIAVGAKNKGFLLSRDEGKTWKEMNEGLTDPIILSLAFHPSNPQIIFAGGWCGGIFKSVDGGRSWKPANNGLAAGSVTAIIFDPSNHQRVFTGADSGVFCSSDGGLSWVDMNRGLKDTRVVSLAVNFKNNLMLAGGVGGVFQSELDKPSWRRCGNIPQEFYSAVAIHPQNSQILFAGTDDYGTARKHCMLLRSVDGGDHWSKQEGSNWSRRISAFAFDPNNSETLLIGSSDGVHRLKNDTSHFRLLFHGFDCFCVAFNPHDSRIIYSGHKTIGLYKTTNGREKWDDKGLGNLWINSLAVDPKNPRVIYIGDKNDSLGIHRSLDGGESWSLIKVDFPSSSILSLAIDPVESNRVLVGTQHMGLWLYDSKEAEKNGPGPSEPQ